MKDVNKAVIDRGKYVVVWENEIVNRNCIWTLDVHVRRLNEFPQNEYPRTKLNGIFTAPLFGNKLPFEKWPIFISTFTLL